jgi:phosphoribosyl-ATP pyrophosphohydrolase/phosphoribosyl-AMP cyclohydrolase
MSTDLSFLSQLEEIIQSRIDNPATESYVSQLVASGEKRVAQKIGEEAVELSIAAVAGDSQEQLNEAADLLFHLLVLLRTKNLTLQDVAATLEQRNDAKH